MNAIRNAAMLTACLMTGAALAQTTKPPLNLQLPPSDMPVAASTAPSHPRIDRYGNPVSPPGVYYGDHSGPAAPVGDERVAAQHCDDATYNQPQMHGSASMGVMAGNHVSGNYQTGSVSVSKAFGSCDDPHGGISFSVSSGTGNFHGRGRGH